MRRVQIWTTFSAFLLRSGNEFVSPARVHLSVLKAFLQIVSTENFDQNLLIQSSAMGTTEW